MDKGEESLIIFLEGEERKCVGMETRKKTKIHPQKEQ
jgi:hypothetical protein